METIQSTTTEQLVNLIADASSLDEIQQAETELQQNRMYLDHYRTASKNIRGIDRNCRWVHPSLLRLVHTILAYILTAN